MLRTALALSTITKKPFKMINIRKSRPKPGLKKQHNSCINAYVELFKCKVIGNFIESQEIEFYPGDRKKKKLDLDIGTAGSITLLLQSIIFPLFVEGSGYKIKIKGGTDVKWSMPIDYFTEIILPHFRRFSDYEITLNKRGFYPKGGGEIELKIKKHNYNIIKKINLNTEARLECIKGISFASKELENKKVAERQSQAATNIFLKNKVITRISNMYYQTESIGSSITLWAVYSKNDDIDYINQLKTGSDALGEINLSSENVGEKAAKKLIDIISDGFKCDVHLSDNLIPLLALIGGTIKIEKESEHIKNNILVCEKFTKTKFNIKNNIIIANKN